MASKIYENGKSMSAISSNEADCVWRCFMIPLGGSPLGGFDCAPLIAKGNIYQGIVAQW